MMGEKKYRTIVADPLIQQQSKRDVLFYRALGTLVALQLIFDVFVLYRLQHQEQMNREQVKFDTTVAAKMFGYDATRHTNASTVHITVTNDIELHNPYYHPR